MDAEDMSEDEAAFQKSDCGSKLDNAKTDIDSNTHLDVPNRLTDFFSTLPFI